MADESRAKPTQKKSNRAPTGAYWLQRYAAECRVLAYECAEGTAPPFITKEFETEEGRCAIGWVLHRTDPTSKAWVTFWVLADAIGNHCVPMDAADRNAKADAAVIDANNKTHPRQRHAACVFPLLWLADEVDALAKQRAA